MNLGWKNPIPVETVDQATPRRVQSCSDPHLLAARWMGERELQGMQQQPMAAEELLEQPIVIAPSMLAIANDGVMDMREVFSDLPETPRSWRSQHQGIALAFIAAKRNGHFDHAKPLVVGHRILPRSGIA